MGRADYQEPGGWNAICSLCGRKRKADEMEKNWQGQWRCPQHNEPRQPQDFVRAIADIQTPAWTQPPSDVFVEFCTPNGLTALVDVGCVDCMTVNYISPSYYTMTTADG